MTSLAMPMPAPHTFWQVIEPARGALEQRFRESYPAVLPDSRVLRLPLRVLPDNDEHAVGSLIVNQASFAVQDALVGHMAELAQAAQPEIVVGVPTLGLPLAEGMARRLGHMRFVPLGTSRKFWYDEALSEPLGSITSPTAPKRLYIDPRMVPLLEGRRVAVVDDALSSGRSMTAVLRLLARIGVEPVAIVVAMLQTQRWRRRLEEAAPGIADKVGGAFFSPLLIRGSDGLWSRAADQG